MRIRIEYPGEPAREEIVPCVRERLIRSTRFGPMEFEQSGTIKGVHIFRPSKPKAPEQFESVPLPLTDYVGDEYEIRLLQVGYGLGSSSRMLSNAYSPEDADADMRLAKARKARAAVKDPYGRQRKQREGNSQ